MEVKPQTSTKSRPKDLRSINDNYCVSNVVGLKDSVIVSDKMEGLNPPPVTDQKNSKVTLNVDSCVASVPIVTGLPQRKGVNPNACQLYTKIKYVKNVFCSVNLVTNAQHAVIDPPVGARLQQCWEKWETLGSSPKVVNTLREGYTLPFWFRPHFTRSPTVISNYHNPTKQSFLLEALSQLINKNAVEPVENQNSLGFYNRLFLVPKPNNRWRPILDLSTLNTFLNTGTFKMETPETIRTSLQVGEWVTSIDFKDAYFHIPIHSQSRKYMRFHLQGRSYQFKALPFGLSTAPMEFTVVAKEVKLMALQKGIRIHQYLDDWLGESLYPPHLSPAYSNPSHTLSGIRVAGEQRKVRAGSQTGLQLCRLPVRPERGQGQTNRRTLAGLDTQDQINTVGSALPSPTIHVPHRSTHSNGKASPLRATTHETHTVALEKQLEGPRITGKGDTGPQVPPPPSKVVAGGKQCATRSTITPSKTCSADLYRRIKRRVGRSLG